eukprot:CAMPEP_0204038230 /NCGR_PEP_ID=MMETSP0360-20130528/86601_1 /ASSEMBLY_ACC=CAM_ASM_000342 /TAXON_ID=268821 /ORGANISM="Scrippsiella Hangoei, Strain SHTV-5" /LENGTH=33 /DNA_ID= /DNA_START= /DNA_END= /DNA_ORIENTATION=
MACYLAYFSNAPEVSSQVFPQTGEQQDVELSEV